jgi:DNA invertase Pin-like site-specific DNA recombinase
MITNSAKDAQKQRCAIYTRSSTEAGSNSAFHTVNAQFTACAEYIGSQVGRGWRLVDALYEDRGYSGSHLRRPGLQSVLADIRYGLIDVLVVYRLDRLTRSLSDFQQLMALFNDHNVSLVSLTQEVDMSHYVGRLATNVLMSFAEFEREMIGQRVKEKRASTLAKGLWQGTSSPLGYVIKHDRLVVEPTESGIVREIFTRYANNESVTHLLKDLNQRGVKTKQWRTREGKLRGGKAFNRNAIYVLLKNRVYLGEVYYDGAWRRGSHEPIIDGALWAQVEALLSARSRRGESKATADNDTIFLLKGRVFGADGRAMSPWLSSAHNGRKYAYYIPQREIAEGAGASGLPRLQARNLNDQVWDFLRRSLVEPQFLIDHLPDALTSAPAFDAGLIVQRLANLEGLSETLFPVNQKRILQLLVDRVTVHLDRLQIDLSFDGFMTLVYELLADHPNLVAEYRKLYAAAKMGGPA